MCKEAINKCGAAACPGPAANACGGAGTAPSVGLSVYDGSDLASLLGPRAVKIVFVPQPTDAAAWPGEEPPQ